MYLSLNNYTFLVLCNPADSRPSDLVQSYVSYILLKITGKAYLEGVCYMYLYYSVNFCKNEKLCIYAGYQTKPDFGTSMQI